MAFQKIHNAGPAKPKISLAGPGLHNANTKGGSTKISKPNPPAKVLPRH